MIVNSDIKYQELLLSSAINNKFGSIYGASGVAFGFDMYAWVSGLAVSIDTGIAIINGVHIEELEVNNVALPEATSGDYSAYIIMKYTHETNSAIYKYEYTGYILEDDEIILATVIVRNGAILIDDDDISISDKILYNLSDPINSVYDFNLDGLNTNDKSSIVSAINEIFNGGKVNINNLVKEVSSMKLYQEVSQRVAGTNITLYGTDFTADLEVDSSEKKETLIVSANTGDSQVEVAFNDKFLSGQEINLKEGLTVEQRIIDTIIESASMSTGADSSHSSGDAWYNSATQIGTDKVIVCYEDRNNLSYGTACVLTISGTTITKGPDLVFAGEVSDVVVVSLGTDKALVCYEDEGNNSYGTANVLTVSGTTISQGADAIFNNTGATRFISAATINTDKVLVSYSDDFDGDKGKACVLSVSGTTITPGAEEVFYLGSVYYTSTAKLDTDKAIVTFQKVTNSDGAAVIVTISGTTITAGVSTVFSGYAMYTSVVKMDADKALVGYRRLTGGGGSACVLSISGTTITAGSEFSFNDLSTRYVRLIQSGTDKALVCYEDEGDSNKGKACILTASGVDISVSGKFIFNADNGTDFIDSAVLDTDKFIVCYRDASSTGMSNVLSVTPSKAISFTEVLENSYTASAEIIRNQDNIVADGGVANIRLDINSTAITHDTVSVIIICDKRIGLDYEAFISIVDSTANENYIELILDQQSDLENDTQELVFSGSAEVPADKATVKIIVTNDSGEVAEIIKILGGLE